MDSHQLYKATARLNQVVSCDNEWFQFDAAGAIEFHLPGSGVKVQNRLSAKE